MSVVAVRDFLSRQGSATLADVVRATGVDASMAEAALLFLVRKGQAECHSDVVGGQSCGGCSKAGKAGSCCAGGTLDLGALAAVEWYAWAGPRVY